MVITYVGIIKSDKSVEQQGKCFHEENLTTTYLFIYLILFNL